MNELKEMTAVKENKLQFQKQKQHSIYDRLFTKEKCHTQNSKQIKSHVHFKHCLVAFRTYMYYSYIVAYTVTFRDLSSRKTEV